MATVPTALQPKRRVRRETAGRRRQGRARVAGGGGAYLLRSLCRRGAKATVEELNHPGNARVDVGVRLKSASSCTGTPSA